jgi:hypothetical protein
MRHVSHRFLIGHIFKIRVRVGSNSVGAADTGNKGQHLYFIPRSLSSIIILCFLYVSSSTFRYDCEIWRKINAVSQHYVKEIFSSVINLLV